MKIFKSKFFWGIIVVLFIAGVGFGYYQAVFKIEETEYLVEPVKRGRLVQTVAATGAVESAKDIELNFKTTGRINYLKISEGEEVKAGQLLAALSSGDLAAQADQYRANLAAIRADLTKVKAGASAEEISVVEKKVEKAENDLEKLIEERDDELAALREKTLNGLNNGYFTAREALNIAYNELFNSETTADISLPDNNLKVATETDYHSLSDKILEIKLVIDLANQEKTNQGILGAADRLRVFLNDLNLFLTNCYQLADGIIINNKYTQSDKDAVKSNLSTEQAAVNTSLNSLQTAKSNLASAIKSYQTEIQAAEDGLSIYQAELAVTKADPRDFEVDSAEAKVAQARAQLNKILAELSDYSIIAPINGTVTEVNYGLGEQTSLSEPVVKILGLQDYQIKANIPESDIVKVEVGDQAVIEMDAFGGDHLFSGIISFIEPAQTVIQDVIYYKATVAFQKDEWNKKVKPGMTADLTIKTVAKDDVLYIPQRAVRLKETILGEAPEKFVEILEDGRLEEKTVVTGLRADQGLVEIISGLRVGESVVVFKKNNGQ